MPLGFGYVPLKGGANSAQIRKLGEVLNCSNSFWTTFLRKRPKGLPQKYFSQSHPPEIRIFEINSS